MIVALFPLNFYLLRKYKHANIHVCIYGTKCPISDLITSQSSNYTCRDSDESSSSDSESEDDLQSWIDQRKKARAGAATAAARNNESGTQDLTQRSTEYDRNQNVVANNER